MSFGCESCAIGKFQDLAVSITYGCKFVKVANSM